jgi:hypothetical protein
MHESENTRGIIHFSVHSIITIYARNIRVLLNYKLNDVYLVTLQYAYGFLVQENELSRTLGRMTKLCLMLSLCTTL